MNDSGWSLGALSAAMDEQARQRRVEQADRNVKLLAQLPEAMAQLFGLDDNDLLKLYLQYNQQSYGGMWKDRRETAIWRRMRMAARKEILRRMEEPK